MRTALWSGPAGRQLASVAYVLTGLARLSHVWALGLPSLLAAPASGAGTIAGWILMIGIARELGRGGGTQFPTPAA